MKRLGTLFLATVLILVMITGCGGQVTESEEVITNIAEYEDTISEILDADFYETEDGASVVRVRFKFTNNQSNGLYLLECFAVHAFQNDVELDDLTNINEEAEDGDSAEFIREIKNGASLEASYVFLLSDDSDVEIRVCTPTADEVLLAQKTFSK